MNLNIKTIDGIKNILWTLKIWCKAVILYRNYKFVNWEEFCKEIKLDSSKPKDKIMKKSILIVMLMACICSAAIKTGSYTPAPTNINANPKARTLYWELATDVNSAGVVQPTDFNDSTTAVFSSTMPYMGMIYNIKLDPNGTDTSLDIDVYVNPVEPNSTLTSSQAYRLDTYNLSCTADPNTYVYGVSTLDKSSNVAIGWRINGFITIRVRNTTHATCDNIKVYLEGKLD